MTKLYVLIGVDCDPDRVYLNKRVKSQEISWFSFIRFYKYFNSIRNRIIDNTGLMPILTLNIRADEQIKQINGKYNYCFNLFEKYLIKDFNKKDELSWHNHHFRFKNDSWIQEKTDQNWLIENINKSFEKIKQYNINTLHTGWCFQNTFTMNLYNDLGIKIDYSALPKMFKTFGNYDNYDYRFVKNNYIYIPSRNDYQKEDVSGQNKILEIPVTTVYNYFLNFLRMFDDFQKTKQISSFNIQNTYLSISTNPFLYNIFLNNIFKQHDLKYFAAFFHSDELLPDEFKPKKILWLFKQNNIYQNLKKLIELAKQYNKDIEFINFKDFYKIYKKEGL